MHFTDLKIYQDAMVVGEMAWDIASKWSPLAKDTVGKQIIRSADSIAANISEGYGRYHFKDRLRFYYFARGSLYETSTWLTKASKRSLIAQEEFAVMERMTSKLGVELNRYIASIKRADKRR